MGWCGIRDGMVHIIERVILARKTRMMMKGTRAQEGKRN